VRRGRGKLLYKNRTIGKKKEKQKEKQEKTETGKEKKFLILFLLQFSATNHREEQ